MVPASKMAPLVHADGSFGPRARADFARVVVAGVEAQLAVWRRDLELFHGDVGQVLLADVHRVDALRKDGGEERRIAKGLHTRPNETESCAHGSTRSRTSTRSF